MLSILYNILNRTLDDPILKNAAHYGYQGQDPVKDQDHLYDFQREIENIPNNTLVRFSIYPPQNYFSSKEDFFRQTHHLNPHGFFYLPINAEHSWETLVCYFLKLLENKIIRQPYFSVPQETMDSQLFHAAAFNQLKLATLLLRLGSKAASVNPATGFTPLLTAARNNTSTSLLELLLENGSNVKEQTSIGKTALMYSATCHSLDACTLLLNHGAEIDKQDAQGWTALMFAVDSCSIVTVEYFVKKGASMSIKNADGDTALTLAEKQSHSKILSYLKDFFSSILEVSSYTEPDLVSLIGAEVSTTISPVESPADGIKNEAYSQATQAGLSSTALSQNGSGTLFDESTWDIV